ncbi:hypothetical protein [Nonomuraea monospora]
MSVPSSHPNDHNPDIPHVRKVVLNGVAVPFERAGSLVHAAA